MREREGGTPPSPADPARARKLYRAHAPAYDRWQWLRFSRYRLHVVDLLDLRPGERVIDVGCGTGLCFRMIEERIGPEGTVVGVDLSPEMVAQARARVARRGWRNISLVVADVAEADLEGTFDAALFCFTHDVLQSPAALDNVFSHLREGGRFACAGPVWAPWWAAGLNALMALELPLYVTTFDGLDRPWRHLEARVPDLEVERGFPPVFYYATGHAAPRGQEAASTAEPAAAHAG